MQLPLFEPKSDWRPPDLGTLPDWADAKRLCIDVETKDPNLRELGPGVRRGSHICGFSFKIEDGPGAYLPFRHEGGDNLPVENCLAYLRHNARRFKGIVVGANLSYDLDFSWQEDIVFPEVEKYVDIQVVDPLINELEDQRSLDAIAKRWGLSGKNQGTLEEAAKAYGVDPKGGMYKLPARFVGGYAETDTEQPLLVLRRQERVVDERDLWNIYNLEAQVLPCLVRMRRRGVRVDIDRLRNIETWSIDEERKALQVVRDQTGSRIEVGDVWKAKALVPALNHIGIKVLTNGKGQPVGIDQELFDSGDHPVLKAIARARKVNKLRTTFAASIRKHMVNGRIHCTFNQIAGEQEDGQVKGARYGRLSCVTPNMQQQPSRDEFAAMWRSIYIPEEGMLWASKDYSQQEPKWTTHFAALLDLPKARQAAQAYHDDPKLDNHQFMADLTGLPRKYAKNIYLGLCYGEGGGKLCRELGLPTRWALSIGRGRERRVEYFSSQEEAWKERANHREGFIWEAAGEEGQKILDTFDERAPFIRLLAKKAEETAKQRGHIITGGGRHMHFKQNEDGSYFDTRKALNRLIQGTSADQTKLAIVLLDKTPLFMQLQVHDEIDSSVGSREEAEAAAKVMRECMPALVPFRVDVEIGPSWGEIK
jgi:DNA polymerase I-like protein with 3'-5' exonuclease and polymerase domains